MPDLEQWPTGRLLTTAARLVEHAWNERLVDIGVTHAGIIALGVLADQGALTQAGLAQQRLMKKVWTEAGAKKMWTFQRNAHIIGTCVMGDNAAPETTSAVSIPSA